MFASLTLPPMKAAGALAIGAAGAVVCYALGPADHRLYGIPLSFILAWAAVVDLDRFILPNFLTLGLIIGGLIIAWTEGQAVFIDRLIGAAAGYLLLVAVQIGYRALRKREGLGRGDAKLLGAAGAWLGWAMLPLVMLFASIGGLVVALVNAARMRKLDGGQVIAFGPFIALGFWLAYVFPHLFPLFPVAG